MGVALNGIVCMLNRQRWNANHFHEALVSLLGVEAGDRVLDLGCGRGASLGPLLKRAGDDGKVIGFDRPVSSFGDVDVEHADDIRNGRLILRAGDALNLPFADGTFDRILCQNVVECVDDRPALVAEAKRVLAPGGTLLLGHHDFDGIMIAGSDRDLTRRLVQGYAGHQQDWQDACEGQMGRLLPGLIASAGFERVEIETRVFTDLDLNEGSYALGYVGSVVVLAPAMGVDRGQAEHWAQELYSAASKGHFFFALPWVAAICRRGDG